ncbi:MAG: stage II sporulation protein M [Bacilli bacterium]
MSSKKHNNINSQKKKYIFLLVIVIVGLIFGIVFSQVISKSDKLVVDNTVTNFFSSIEKGSIDYKDGLKSSVLSNILYLSSVWFLGMSVIGLPIVLFLLFMKGFILGFSIGSIIRIYKLKGIIGAFLYIFPHHIISIIISILITFYAVMFSIKLFKYLFLHQEINFKSLMKKYFKILLICFISFIICSLLETYLSPILINIFNLIN